MVVKLVMVGNGVGFLGKRKMRELVVASQVGPEGEWWTGGWLGKGGGHGNI